MSTSEKSRLRLNGKVAVVTGASSGVGAEISKLFSDEGATVIMVARNKALIDEHAAEICSAGGKAYGLAGDVSDENNVSDIFSKAFSMFGKIDVLVNCAGVTDWCQGILRTDKQLVDKMYSINALGTFLCCKEALKYMLPSKSGTIVNFSSNSGLKGHGGPSYAMSKGAVISLTKSIAIENHLNGIRANVICPGTILTQMVLSPEMSEKGDPSIFNALAKHTATLDTPPSTAEEMARVALFLACDDSVCLNGVAIQADKGLAL